MTNERASKLNSIISALRGAGASGLTRSEIAGVLSLKKSPYLLQLIDKLITEGYATQEFYQNCYPPRYIIYDTGKAAREEQLQNETGS